jgi:hypothetical protein
MLTLRQREIALADAVMAKKRVYLDLKYWIYCRDVRAGLKADPAKQQVFDLLRQATKAGVLVCPIEESVLTELLKQGDPVRRRQMAETMDELSGGVCLKPYFTRIEAEILHFSYGFWLPEVSLLNLNQLIWTRVAFVLGAFAPHLGSANAEQNANLAESFDAHLWSMNTVDLLTYMDDDGDPLATVRPDYDCLARTINEGNDVHSFATSAFDQIYREEVAGAFDACSDLILGAIGLLHSRYPTVVPQPPAGGDIQNVSSLPFSQTAFLSRSCGGSFHQFISKRAFTPA